MTLYDTIGQGYNHTRQADAYVADRLYTLLEPVTDGIYMDVGCGTGNYLGALSQKGLRLYGVDPSAVMLAEARAKNPDTVFIETAAENIALPDAFFNGAVAVLTIHHWQNMLQGLREIRRLLQPGAKMVLFSYTPEQVGQYWLQHYFPQMIQRCMQSTPRLEDMLSLFNAAGFSQVSTEKYFVQPDLQDHFMYAGKHAPGRYLDARFRSGISAFRALVSDEELAAGLGALSGDIDTGAVHDIMQQYKNETGDYLFFIATA